VKRKSESVHRSLHPEKKPLGGKKESVWEARARDGGRKRGKFAVGEGGSGQVNKGHAKSWDERRK